MSTVTVYIGEAEVAAILSGMWGVIWFSALTQSAGQTACRDPIAPPLLPLLFLLLHSLPPSPFPSIVISLHPLLGLFFLLHPIFLYFFRFFFFPLLPFLLISPINISSSISTQPFSSTSTSSSFSSSTHSSHFPLIISLSLFLLLSLLPPPPPFHLFPLLALLILLLFLTHIHIFFSFLYFFLNHPTMPVWKQDWLTDWTLCHDECVVARAPAGGRCNLGDRVSFWEVRGHKWGGVGGRWGA